MAAVLKEYESRSDAEPVVERRQNRVLRERFEFACRLLKPVLSRPEQQSGTGFFRAMSQLQVTYPDLSASEIEALVSAVVRTLANRQTPSAKH